MMSPVNHIYVNRPGPWGGTFHTTLCGRMALPTEKVSATSEVTCKLCLRKKSSVLSPPAAGAPAPHRYRRGCGCEACLKTFRERRERRLIGTLPAKPEKPILSGMSPTEAFAEGQKIRNGGK